MSSSALEAILKHDGRLDLLCCILDGGPLSVLQLSARTGEPAKAVGHWVDLLEAFGLVERVANLNDGEALYVASLENHPDWVRQIIDGHRRT